MSVIKDEKANDPRPHQSNIPSKLSSTDTLAFFFFGGSSLSFPFPFPFCELPIHSGSSMSLSSSRSITTLDPVLSNRLRFVGDDDGPGAGCDDEEAKGWLSEEAKGVLSGTRCEEVEAWGPGEEGVGEEESGMILVSRLLEAEANAGSTSGWGSSRANDDPSFFSHAGILILLRSTLWLDACGRTDGPASLSRRSSFTNF